MSGLKRSILTHRWILSLVILSCLPLISMLRVGTYESGDLTFQAYKLFSFYQNISNGHVVPQWSAELNASYGYPQFIFTYHLPYYIASIFHFFGFHLINSVKLTLALTYLLSGLFFYLWIRNHTSEKAAFVGALLYQFAPYRFVTMHFRATLGESTALMILPLCALALYTYFEKKTYASEIYAGITLAFLILSHQAVSMLGIPFLLSYALYLGHFSFLKVLRPFIIGLLLSAYYWMPILLESQYTLQAQSVISVLHYSLIEFFISPWRYGLLYQGPHGELSPALGYVHWFVIIIACHLFIQKKLKDFGILMLLLFIIYFLSAQSFSPTWKLLPILNKIQFSYRFLGVLVFISATLGAFLSQKIKTFHLYVLISVLFITTFINWGNRKVIPYAPHSDFIAFSPYITEKGEGFDPAIPKWVDSKHPWKTVVPSKHVESVDGHIRLVREKRGYTDHLYWVDIPRDLLLIENTYFFPGWHVFVDGIERPITPYQGLITFSAPSGTHTIDVRFTQTPIRQFSSIISLVALFLIITYPLYKPKHAH